MNAKVMKDIVENAGSFKNIAICETLSAFDTLTFNPRYALVTGANTDNYMFQTFIIKVGETLTFPYVTLSTSGTTLQSQGRVSMIMEVNSVTNKVSLGFLYSPPQGLSEAIRVIAFA